MGRKSECASGVRCREHRTYCTYTVLCPANLRSLNLGVGFSPVPHPPIQPSFFVVVVFVVVVACVRAHCVCARMRPVFFFQLSPLSQLEVIRLEHYFLVIHIFRLRYGFQFISNGFAYNELRFVSTGISFHLQCNTMMSHWPAMDAVSLQRVTMTSVRPRLQ